MICFDVYRNGEKLCRAGRNELAVLSGILSFVDSVHDDGPPITLDIGGLYINEFDANVHPQWIERLAINEGDEITFRIVRSETADPAAIERVSDAEQDHRSEHDYYLHLRQKFEPED
ncbi:MAG: hypothetical protein IPM21_01090 [Acidobacteria bacterium]|nr:hypothetical protein [Acidobacteriota bacterium]